jgi:uncharacterized Zn ribbon protein
MVKKKGQLSTEIKQCRQCGNEFRGRANKHYCSDRCATGARVARHRKKKSESQIRKYVKKADRFLQTGFALYLLKELKRAGTVQILEGHTADTLHELHRLKRQCSKYSGYSDGKPTGRYQMSHIWSVKASNAKLGLLHPQNIVIATKEFNLRHGAKQPSRLDVGLYLPTAALLEKHKLREHDTAEQVFKKVEKFLGHEWKSFIATLTIQQTQEQQLRAQLKKLEIPAPAHLSLDELRQHAENHQVNYFSANFTAAYPVDVALSELDRFDHSSGEFSVFYRWLQLLQDADWSLDVREEIKDREQVESCILSDVWAILHGVSLPKRSLRQQQALLGFNRENTQRPQTVPPHEKDKEQHQETAEELDWIL